MQVDGALLAVHGAVLHGASADAAEMFFATAMLAAKNDLSALS